MRSKTKHIFRCVCIWSSIFFIVYAENVHVSNDYTAINFSQDTSTFHRTADGPYHAFYDVDGTVSQICSLPLMFLFLIRISMVFNTPLFPEQIYDGTMAHCAWWFATALPNPFQRVSKACQARAESE